MLDSPDVCVCPHVCIRVYLERLLGGPRTDGRRVGTRVVALELGFALYHPVAREMGRGRNRGAQAYNYPK